MKISLILATLHRTHEVQALLTSLTQQTYSHFEVIIIDQNSDERITPLIQSFDQLDILHLRSAIGLSLARNVGLSHASGEIVGFPDDDCTYPPMLLQSIVAFFQQGAYPLLTGKTIDPTSQQIVAGSLHTTPTPLSCTQIHGSSTTLFIATATLGTLRFDERFGLGAKYHAEEENELILRLLQQGVKGYYHPEINTVYHPPSDLDYHDTTRIAYRAVGLGAFIAKYLGSLCGVHYLIKYALIRPLLGSLLYRLKGDPIKARFYFAKFRGIWQGLLTYLKEERS